MKSSVLEHFDTLRPHEVRLLARRRGRRITNKQIAKASGLSLAMISRISRKPSWKTIPVGIAQRFAEACGHDLLRPRRNLQYIARFIRTGRGFKHMTEREQTKLVLIAEKLSE